MRPGHHWFCEVGDAGNATSCEKQFNLSHHAWEDSRMIGAYSSTKKTVWSNGDSTEWKRMCQDSRSKSGRRMLIHHGHMWLWWSTQVNYVPLVSSSRKCFLHHLRQEHVVVCGHEEWDCEVLRNWNVAFFQCVTSRHWPPLVPISRWTLQDVLLIVISFFGDTLSHKFKSWAFLFTLLVVSLLPRVKDFCP